MRVVIRLRRKSAKVEPSLSLASNGEESFARETVSSVAVAEPRADELERDEPASVGPSVVGELVEPTARMVQPELVIPPEVTTPIREEVALPPAEWKPPAPEPPMAPPEPITADSVALPSLEEITLPPAALKQPAPESIVPPEPAPIARLAPPEPSTADSVTLPSLEEIALPPAAWKQPAPEPITSPEPEPVAKLAPEPVTPTDPAPAPQHTPVIRKEKVRCPRCNSVDTWRFGRVKGFRLAMASLAKGQWVTCRGCGNRFLTRQYGPMEEEDDD